MNFREDVVEKLRKAKTDPLQYEAERFLCEAEKILCNVGEVLKALEAECFKPIISLDFVYQKVNGGMELITFSIDENDYLVSKFYPYNNGKEIFKKIREHIRTVFPKEEIFCDEEYHISIKL